MNTDTLITGIKGVALVNVAPALVEVAASNLQSPEQVSGVLQLITTIVVSVVSLWKLIKKPKPKTV